MSQRSGQCLHRSAIRNKVELLRSSSSVPFQGKRSKLHVIMDELSSSNDSLCEPNIWSVEMAKKKQVDRKKGSARVGKRPRTPVRNARVVSDATTSLTAQSAVRRGEHEAVAVTLTHETDFPEQRVQNENVPVPVKASEVESQSKNPGAQPSPATAQASHPSRRFHVPYVPRSLYWPQR